jgi:hypothetical protein
VIPITKFAIGSSLPEQVLLPLSSGTGFTVEGNLGGNCFSVVPQTLTDCRSFEQRRTNTPYFQSSFAEKYSKRVRNLNTELPNLITTMHRLNRLHT